MSLEEAYLDHILIHLNHGDRDDSLLTTFMNSWFAHHAGQPFVDGKLRPLWLSKKVSKKTLAEHLHARSLAAIQACSEGRYEDVVIDHTVPSAFLVKALKARKFAGRADLREFLSRRFTLTLLTKTQHHENLKPFKSTMTDAWSEEAFEANSLIRFCRYTHPLVGIEFVLRQAEAT